MAEIAQSDKPVANIQCGWCNTKHHDKCQDNGGFTQFTMGVHSGNQCKCFDNGHEEKK